MEANSCNPEYHHKGWGYEKWIANNEKYCGKILHFFKGKQCSWHYHNVKDETFYIQSGKLKVRFGSNDEWNGESIILQAGDSFHIPPGLRHQMYALMETDLFEFSTQHLEEDSIRIIKGD